MGSRGQRGQRMNDDFRYIAAIAEHGSISQAARAMHISQPGLSQRLKRLETQLGTELFDRTTSPMHPTSTGEVYIKYALKAIAAEDDMRREVYSTMRRHRQRLRIGTSMARANALLAGPIVSFYEEQKGCTVELREMGTFDQMHKMFLGDEIDFAVLTPISPDPTAYTMEVLCHERLLAVIAKQLYAPMFEHALDRVFLRQLEGIPFILPTCGRYFDPLISRLIDASNVRLDIVVRDCSAELALALVQDGLGVSIAPSTWVLGHENLQTFELADVEAGNVLRYICRKNHSPSQEELLFMSILRDWLAKAR